MCYNNAQEAAEVQNWFILTACVRPGRHWKHTRLQAKTVQSMQLVFSQL